VLDEVALLPEQARGRVILGVGHGRRAVLAEGIEHVNLFVDVLDGYDPLSPVVDATELDRQAEMDWFARAYSAELGALASHFGTAPGIRWGLVSKPTPG
jgi:hypothetical protein